VCSFDKAKVELFEWLPNPKGINGVSFSVNGVFEVMNDWSDKVLYRSSLKIVI